MLEKVPSRPSKTQYQQCPNEAGAFENHPSTRPDHLKSKAQKEKETLFKAIDSDSRINNISAEDRCNHIQNLGFSEGSALAILQYAVSDDSEKKYAALDGLMRRDNLPSSLKEYRFQLNSATSMKDTMHAMSPYTKAAGLVAGAAGLTAVIASGGALAVLGSIFGFGLGGSAAGATALKSTSAAEESIRAGVIWDTLKKPVDHSTPLLSKEPARNGISYGTFSG